MPEMPNWVSGAAILAAAAAVALLAHWLSLRLVPRVPVPGRARGFLETFITATTGPSRLAVVVLALWAALPTAHFPAAAFRGVGQALLVGLIVLVGWSAMRAIEVAAALHLRRFRLDVDDNLLARKHVTQVHVLRRAGGILIALVTAAAALMSFESVRALRRQPVRLGGRRQPRGRPGGAAAAHQPDRRRPDRHHPADPPGGRGDRRGRVGLGRGDHQHLRRGPAVGLAAHGPAAVLLPGEAVPELDARDQLADRLGVPVRRLLRAGRGGAAGSSRRSPARARCGTARW